MFEEIRSTALNAISIVSVVLVIAVIGWMAYRQSTWTPISPASVWRTPAIVAGIGVLLLFNSGMLEDLNGADVGLLVLELGVGAGVGVAIGRLAHLRPVSAQALKSHAEGRRATDPAPVFEARNGIFGLILWFALIAFRIVLGFWSQSWGVHLAESTGLILMVLGINRLVRTLVILSRAPRVLNARQA